MSASAQRFDDVAVVLVNPSGRRNIGATARAMKNTGFTDLVLVGAPVICCLETDFRCRETYDMAPNSHDVLDRARSVSTLAEALADRHVAFGVTARTRFKRKRLTPAETVLACGRYRTEQRKGALVVGREGDGRSNSHLALCRHLIGIPTHPDLPSLNLSQAVLLVCYAFYSGGLPAAKKEANDRRELSSLEDKKRIEAGLAALLTAGGFLTPAREKPVRDTIQRLAYKGEIETRDTRNVLAAVRHLRHVLKKKS